jgi:hypothetical protein
MKAVRIVIKAAVLFALANALFAWAQPLEQLGRLSVYNTLVPGRERLPYGENPTESYNLSTYNVPALFASHTLSRAKAPDQFRVLLLGDSSTWGWFLRVEDTLAAYINTGNYVVDKREVVAYNFGYPIMSLTKDLMLLDEAMQYQPDMIVWLVTLASFPREKQIFPPLVYNNPARVQTLIERYALGLDVQDARFVQRTFWDNTLIGQRRELANWLRLQTYGFSWMATAVDQFIPDDIPLRQTEFDDDLSWESFDAPAALTDDDLAFDVLAAGVTLVGDVPVLIVNEPMYVSDDDLRYNSFYPRWAYDAYRERLAQEAAEHGWRFLDVWDSIAPEEFTDTPVHLTPTGSAQLSRMIGEAIEDTLHG